MRVLLLVDRYLPYPTSQAKLVRDLGVELLRLGHQASVLTPSEDVAAQFDVTHEGGLEVLRVRTPRIKAARYAVRAMREEQLPRLLWRAAGAHLKANRFDLVAYYSPTIFFGRFVARLKRMWRCRSYLILRDIFPQWAVDAGLLRKRLAWLFFRYRELQQYEAADVIGVEAPRNLEYFKAWWARRYQVEVLYNWMSADAPPQTKLDLRGELGLTTGDVVFVYGGTLGVAQNVEILAILAHSLRLAAPRTHVVVAGTGREVERLRAKVVDEGLTNLHLVPPLPQDDYLGVLKQADVGIVTLDGRLTMHNVPGKALSYMHAGLPILASMNADNFLCELLTARRAGACSPAGDGAALLRNALMLAQSADIRREMGASARRVLEERFSATVAATQLVSSVDRAGG